MTNNEIEKTEADYNFYLAGSNKLIDFRVTKPEYPVEHWNVIERSNKANLQNYISNYSHDNINGTESTINKQNLRSDEMATNDFVTQKELEHLEEKVELKIDNMRLKIDGEFKVINNKIDNLPSIFENMLLKNEKEQEEKRKETNRYIWGTIIIGSLGLIISIVSLFFS